MITKQAEFSEKVEALKQAITDRNTQDDILVLNILNLLGGVSLNDAFFEDPNILFRDIEEFSDIKTELRGELGQLKNDIARSYLAVITSCRALRIVRPEEITALQPLIKLLLLNLGFFQLNTILANNLKNIEVNNLPIIDDGIAIMQTITKSMQMLDVFIKEINGE